MGKQGEKGTGEAAACTQYTGLDVPRVSPVQSVLSF